MLAASRPLLGLAWITTVGFGLACGGLGSRMASDTMAWSLETVVPLDDSPEKQQVIAWGEEGFVQAQTGEVGISVAGDFKRAVEDATADGVLSADEVAKIGQVAQPFAQPGPASPERDAMLEDMRSRMRESRMVKGSAQPAPQTYGIESWDLATLKEHASVLADGGEPVCADSDEGGIVMRSCKLPGGKGTVLWQQADSAESAEVVAEAMQATMAIHREGRTMLMVQYNGFNPARAYAKRWATGTPELTEAWITETVKPDGFTTAMCDTLHIEGSESYSCTLSGDAGKSGMFIVTKKPGAPDAAPREAGGGTIAAVVNEVEVMVSVADPDVNGPVLAAVLAGTPL